MKSSIEKEEEPAVRGPRSGSTSASPLGPPESTIDCTPGFCLPVPCIVKRILFNF